VSKEDNQNKVFEKLKVLLSYTKFFNTNKVNNFNSFSGDY